MKAMFDICDDLMRELREEADRRGNTPSALVEVALGLYLEDCKRFRKDMEAARKAVKENPLPPLPTRNMGKAMVDYADREALYNFFDEVEG